LINQELLYESIYSDGRHGRSQHPQVDSGFGFTCDEEILPFIPVFRSVGIETLSSCQASQMWLVPRRLISYTHDDPSTILRFACHIRDTVPETSGWCQNITVDHYKVPSGIYATLEFTADLDSKMLDATGSFV
jgi:hypothetical protein